MGLFFDRRAPCTMPLNLIRACTTERPPNGDLFALGDRPTTKSFLHSHACRKRARPARTCEHREILLHTIFKVRLACILRKIAFESFIRPAASSIRWQAANFTILSPSPIVAISQIRNLSKDDCHRAYVVGCVPGVHTFSTFSSFRCGSFNLSPGLRYFPLTSYFGGQKKLHRGGPAAARALHAVSTLAAAPAANLTFLHFASVRSSGPTDSLTLMFCTKYSSMLFLKSSLSKVAAARSLSSGSETKMGRRRGTCGRTPA